MKVQFCNGKFNLLQQDVTILSGAAVTIKMSGGESFSPLFSDSSFLKNDGEELHVQAGNAGARSELAIICDKNTAVIRMSAQIPEQEPTFGYQKFLSEKNALTLSCTCPDSGPYTAIYQHKEWWIRPEFCESIYEVPDSTQLLLWKTGVTYFAMLAVCGTKTRADLKGDKGGLVLGLSTNCAGVRGFEDIAAVISCGENPYQCIRDAVRTALGNAGKPYQLREEKRFPELFEYLGWCSWDAFGHDVSEAAILCKMNELREKDIPVKWVLIDDGWSKVNFAKLLLSGLDADPERFPGGLSTTVRHLKEEHGIRWVGVWQAIMGYWNGIDPNSEAFQEFSGDLEVLPSGKVLPRTDTAHCFGFWNKWHQYLKHCGIDFVKVDSQSSISIFQTGRRTFGEASRGIHTGLEASTSLNFDGSLINCMGMAPEDIWNRPQAALSRNSDDFVPKVPHAIREHALQNAYNSLLHGNFYWEDWDMFWSGHEAAKQNAILRALSGGPIYLSEPIGKANPEYIFPLVMDDGRILRCNGVGLPTTDCLFSDPVKGTVPLKIFNHFGKNYAVGVLNISESEQVCRAEISASDIPELQGKTVWIYDWQNRTAARLNPGECYSAELTPDDAKLFLLLPDTDEITVIGLTEKYLSFAAVQQVELLDSELLIKVSQGGSFAFLSRRKITEAFLDGVSVTPIIRGNIHLIECPRKGIHHIRIRSGKLN